MEWLKFPDSLTHIVKVVKCERCKSETFDLRKIEFGSPWDRVTTYLCDGCYSDLLFFLDPEWTNAD